MISLRPALAAGLLALVMGCVPALAQSPSRPAGCPERLRVAFPDSPAEPFLRGQGEAFAERPGVMVEWLRAALRQLGCPAELQRLPIRRVRVLLEAGQIDMVAGVAEGGPLGSLLNLPPREGAKREFDLSLGRVEYALYARRDQAVSWDGSQLQLPPGARVGVSQGSRSEALALERAWPLEAAPNYESSLQKLLAGRTAALLSLSQFLEERLQSDPALARQLHRLEPAVEARYLHIGATQALAQGQPAFTARLWRELCRQSQASRLDGACRLPPGEPVQRP
jgi:ABC-type amino acid transport substrate-binding protein